jgi:hypothetical protein
MAAKDFYHEIVKQALIFEDTFFREILELYALKIVTFDEINPKIVLWKP